MAGGDALTCANGVSVVSGSCPLMQPEVPEKSQGAPSAGRYCQPLWCAVRTRSVALQGCAPELPRMGMWAWPYGEAWHAAWTLAGSVRFCFDGA